MGTSTLCYTDAVTNVTKLRQWRVFELYKPFRRLLTLQISCFITLLTLPTLSLSYNYHNKWAYYPVPDLHNRASWEHICELSSHLDRVKWVEPPIFTLCQCQNCQLFNNLAWFWSSTMVKRKDIHNDWQNIFIEECLRYTQC